MPFNDFNVGERVAMSCGGQVYDNLEKMQTENIGIGVMLVSPDYQKPEDTEEYKYNLHYFGGEKALLVQLRAVRAV